MLGYMIWYNIFKILEILDMILYPILAKISISYLCLSWSFMRSCVNQSQRVFWCFLWNFTHYICCLLFSVTYGSVSSSIFWEMLWCFMQQNSRIVVTLFLPYTESTAKALVIPNTAFARYFEDILTPKKIWI